MLDGPPIPRSFAEEIYKVYTEFCSSKQSLERIEERGGFGYQEILALMKRRQKVLARDNPSADQ